MSNATSHKQALRELVDYFVGSMKGADFKERLVNEISRINERFNNVIELKLCETERLVLRPDTLYRFVVAPDCDHCTELGAIYVQELQQRELQA